MMVPRCKDVCARNSEQASQLCERRDIVISGVTKTQVYSIPLVIQLRMAGTRLPDKIGNAVHLFFAFGNEPFQSLRIVDQTRFSLICNEIHEFSQDRTSGQKQIGVIPGATLVPITERFPFLAIPSRTKNVSLSGENEVRTNW